MTIRALGKNHTNISLFQSWKIHVQTTQQKLKKKKKKLGVTLEFNYSLVAYFFVLVDGLLDLFYFFKFCFWQFEEIKHKVRKKIIQTFRRTYILSRNVCSICGSTMSCSFGKRKYTRWFTPHNLFTNCNSCNSIFFVFFFSERQRECSQVWHKYASLMCLCQIPSSKTFHLERVNWNLQILLYTEKKYENNAFKE